MERFRKNVDMKRNHVSNKWATNYVVTDVVRAHFAFYLTLHVCDRSTRTDGCDGLQKNLNGRPMGISALQVNSGTQC